MLFFCRADEAVERDVQPLIHLFETRGVAGRDLQRRQPFGFRGLNHLQPVLVGAGEKKHILAVEPRKARQRIGRDRLIGMADMRHAIGVRDGGRDVEGLTGQIGRIRHNCEGLSSLFKRPVVIRSG